MALLSINLITVLESPRVLAISNILFCAPWKKWKRRVCYLLNLIILYSKLGIEHKKQPAISCLVSPTFHQSTTMTVGIPLKGKVSNRNGKGAPNSKPKNRHVGLSVNTGMCLTLQEYSACFTHTFWSPYC